MKKELRKLWICLHRKALEYPDNPTPEELADFEQWFTEWVNQLPKQDCPCLSELAEATTVSPLPFEDGGTEVFWWTIALHDRVNVLLGRDVYSERSRSHPLLLDVTLPKSTRKDAPPRYRRRKAQCAGKKCKGKKPANVDK